MEKLFCKQINEQGLDKAIEEYIKKREKAINQYWLGLWLFTCLVYVLTSTLQDKPQINDKEIRSFYQNKVDSLQYFVDTTI
jgi:hypothetical protein